jgi:multisubunit Na+/H+ antiporter MnhC subunit
MDSVLDHLVDLLEDRGESVRMVLGVIFALLASGAVALTAWQAREGLAARQAGNRPQTRDALITALVCTGLAIELAIAALLAL